MNRSGARRIPLLAANTVDTPVGIAPFAMVKGDFNGDQRRRRCGDVVNSNSTDNTVSVLLGNGGLAGQINPDGTVNNSSIFQAPLIYAVGNRPAGIVTGDFNADGKLDIAVANTGDGTASVLYGKGDGTFQPAITLTVGNAPVGIATGDIDGDGNLDLVVANSGDGTLSVLRGNGDGTFQTQTTIPVGSGPQNVTLADFNGDGSLDIAVTNEISNTVSVLLGKGDGTFKAATILPAGSSPFAIIAMDVAASGKVSLAATNLNDGTVSFYQGNGDGTFQTPKTLTVGFPQPTAMAVGDFYANGYLDLAVASSGDQANTVDVFNGFPDSQGDYINGSGANIVGGWIESSGDCGGRHFWSGADRPGDRGQECFQPVRRFGVAASDLNAAGIADLRRHWRSGTRPGGHGQPLRRSDLCAGHE